MKKNKKSLAFILLILLTFSALFLSACGDTTKKGDSDDTVGISSGQNSTQNQAYNLTDDEIEIIVKEVLGQMIFREMDLDQVLSLKGLDSKDLSVSFDAKISDLDKDISVSAISGSADVSIQGKLEQILSYGTTGSVYYYSPLYTNILLSNYTFENPELGTLTVNGQIACIFNGRFSEPTSKLIGSGTCNTGSTQENDPITLTYKNFPFLISYDVDVNVYGQPFDILSYVFRGYFSIDDIKVNLENIFPDLQ